MSGARLELAGPRLAPADGAHDLRPPSIVLVSLSQSASSSGIANNVQHSYGPPHLELAIQMALAPANRAPDLGLGLSNFRPGCGGSAAHRNARVESLPQSRCAGLSPVGRGLRPAQRAAQRLELPETHRKAALAKPKGRRAEVGWFQLMDGSHTRTQTQTHTHTCSNITAYDSCRHLDF